jgi:hypothetical protein
MCDVRRGVAGRDRGDGDVVELDGLLEQAVEEQTAMVRAAAVEAERELRQLVVEVLGCAGGVTAQDRLDPVVPEPCRSRLRSRSQAT